MFLIAVLALLSLASADYIETSWSAKSNRAYDGFVCGAGSHAGNLRGATSEQCKLECELQAGGTCTAINYFPKWKLCVLWRCGYPVPKGVVENNVEGYYLIKTKVTEPRRQPIPFPPCGMQKTGRQDRVIAGKDSVPGEWPWQVAIYANVKNRSTKRYRERFICGGSLVHPLWVVTAAHCVYGEVPRKYTRIVLGDQDRLISEGTEVEYKVRQLIPHPAYNRRTITNDIALIKLDRPVKMTANIGTICLPNSSPAIGSKCFITGWGKMKHPGGAAKVLQKAELKVIPNAVCRDLNTMVTGMPNITEVMLCAGNGYPDLRSGCHGDSGGPFVCQRNPAIWDLQGAVSWGSPRCDSRDGYTVFSRVTEFKEWIMTNIKQNV